MPLNSYSRIVTNKRSRLRLGYSVQSGYEYSTQQTSQGHDSIITLIDEGIKTGDKYGKVTVVVEEN